MDYTLSLHLSSILCLFPLFFVLLLLGVAGKSSIGYMIDSMGTVLRVSTLYFLFVGEQVSFVWPALNQH